MIITSQNEPSYVLIGLETRESLQSFNLLTEALNKLNILLAKSSLAVCVTYLT